MAFAGQTPDLVLLDEVTNHLDLDSVVMLERIFRAYLGTLVGVSHDEVLKQELDLRPFSFKILLQDCWEANC